MVKYALDCEMVGSGNKSLLARVSLVNENGSIIIDEYVKPNAPVTDYRTCVSGIKHQHLENGRSFDFVKQLVRNKISGAILIGHSLHFDLDALGLTHPEQNLRDLAKYKPFLQVSRDFIIIGVPCRKG